MTMEQILAPGSRALGRKLLEIKPDNAAELLGLPDVDGRQLLSMLRAVSAVPVIVAVRRNLGIGSGRDQGRDAA